MYLGIGFDPGDGRRDALPSGLGPTRLIVSEETLRAAGWWRTALGQPHSARNPPGAFCAASSCCHHPLNGVLGTGEGAQDRWHVGQIAQLEAHIAGMTGRGRPDVAEFGCVPNLGVA